MFFPYRIFEDSHLCYQGAKDAPAPRPNKRPRLGPSPTDDLPSKQASKLVKDNATEPKSTPSQLDEFLEVMKPRTKKGPAWANGMKEEQVAAHAKQKQGHESVERAETTEDTEMRDPAAVEGLSDLDWMRMRMSNKVVDMEKVFEQSDDEDIPRKPVGSLSVHNVCYVDNRSDRMLLHQYLNPRKRKTPTRRPSCKRLGSSFVIWHFHAPTQTFKSSLARLVKYLR